MPALLDIVKKDSTDYSITLNFYDSTTGDDETVDHTTTGLSLWYRRKGAAKVAITPKALSALNDNHTDGGVEPIADGNSRIDVPDAAVATGVPYVDFGGSATGILCNGGRVRLTDLDIDDATRGGLLALPDAAADAAGGLPISDAGGLDLDGRLDAAISSRASAANLAIVDGVADAIKAVTDALPNAGALTSLAQNTDVQTLLTRLSAARAGYIDNLNVGGLVASQGDIANITVAARVRVSLPPQFERPDSGSTAYRIWIYIYGDTGQAEAPDSLPTITAENQGGTDRSANLGTVTLDAVGRYYVDYTVSTAHAIEGLVFKVNVVEGGSNYPVAVASLVVDTTAVDFTAADRTLLTDLEARVTAVRAGYLDELAPANIPTDIDTLLTRATEARLAELDEANLPADVAAVPTAVTGGTTVAQAESNIRGADSDTLKTLSDQVDGVGGLNAQGVRDAMKLAPSAGAPATNSIDDKIDSVSGSNTYEVDGYARVLADGSLRAHIWLTLNQTLQDAATAPTVNLVDDTGVVHAASATLTIAEQSDNTWLITKANIGVSNQRLYRLEATFAEVGAARHVSVVFG